MKVLALDTAQGACSVSLAAGGSLVAHQSVRLDRGHAEAILPMVEEVLAQGDLTLDRLDRVAAVTGPGTFTGVRVALSVARALALACRLDTVGASGLTVLAHQAARAGYTGAGLCVLAGRGDDLFYQRFMIDPEPCPLEEPVSGPWRAIVPSDVRWVAGDAPQLEDLARQLGVSALPTAVDSRVLAQMAPGLTPTLLTPLYLKAPDVALSSKKLPWS